MEVEKEFRPGSNGLMLCWWSLTRYADRGEDLSCGAVVVEEIAGEAREDIKKGDQVKRYCSAKVISTDLL